MSLASLLNNVTNEREPYTLEFTAVWTSFCQTNGDMVGLVIEGCENTHTEIEQMDMQSFCAMLPSPPGEGTWKFSGGVQTWRTMEGDYDHDYVGTWTVVPARIRTYGLKRKRAR